MDHAPPMFACPRWTWAHIGRLRRFCHLRRSALRRQASKRAHMCLAVGSGGSNLGAMFAGHLVVR